MTNGSVELARVRRLRGPILFWRVEWRPEAVAHGQRRAQQCRPPDNRRSESGLAGEGEDEEVAFAGDYYGEEAAVGGDSEVAEGKAVQDGDGLRL
jgi:hypothetical protein